MRKINLRKKRLEMVNKLNQSPPPSRYVNLNSATEFNWKIFTFNERLFLYFQMMHSIFLAVFLVPVRLRVK